MIESEAHFLTKCRYKFVVIIYKEQANDIHNYKDITKTYIKQTRDAENCEIV